MKKNPSLLVVVIALGAFLAGCSGGGDDTSKTKPNTPASDAGLSHNVTNRADNAVPN